MSKLLSPDQIRETIRAASSGVGSKRGLAGAPITHEPARERMVTTADLKYRPTGPARRRGALTTSWNPEEL